MSFWSRWFGRRPVPDTVPDADVDDAVRRLRMMSAQLQDTATEIEAYARRRSEGGGVERGGSGT